MAKSKKLKVGIYGITGCMGCQLNVLYQSDLFGILDAIDLRSFPVGKEKNEHKGKLDIIFLEGVVVSKEDLRMVKELRKRATVLVAIGACATDGCVPAIRNFLDDKDTQKVVYHDQTKHLQVVDPSPVDKHVKVDYYVRGCPMDKLEFLQLMKAILSGNDFKVPLKSMCHNCNLQGNLCLLERGRECLGPITFGNCSVMCPDFDHPCIGCRGPFPDANFEAYFTMMERKGFSRKHMMQRINKYAGIKFRELIEKQNENEVDHEHEGHCCFDMFCHSGSDRHKKQPLIKLHKK
ncbi:MAG: hypothetical protein H6502_00190 [Candidatus Woesearchaeota archaeon]|nr:MAG: hypothetical protein H6502_00190 [Candidatus Woesearchaeota archaeon]